MNLDARVTDLPSASFDPNDSTTYHYTQSTIVYDSLGVTHQLDSFFVKTSTNEWSVFVFSDDVNTINAATISAPYTPNGIIQYPATGTGVDPTLIPVMGITVNFAPLNSNGNPTGASSPVSIILDLTDATQFGSDFTSSIEQDGGFIADITLTSTQDNDNLVGGAGDDTAVFNYSTEEIIAIDTDDYISDDIITITGPEGIDTLTSIEILQFTDFTISSPQLLVTVSANDKTIVGTSEYGNLIIPGAATNTILAGNGEDHIVGVSIGETIDGGSGNDTVQLSFASNEVTSIARKLDGSVALTTEQGITTLSNIENIVFQSEPSVNLSDFVALKNADKPVFTFSDGSGGNIEATPELYNGPVDFLQYQLLGDTSSNVMTGSEFNDFLNLQGGDDAANGGDGQDVLDGGTGSNFLTGGSGSDTFYLDGRSSSTTWSTITDFSGDNVNIWGWQEGVSQLIQTVNNAGADGFKGVTFHFDLNNDGDIDTSITFTGLTTDQVPGSSAQSVEGNGYLLFT